MSKRAPLFLFISEVLISSSSSGVTLLTFTIVDIFGIIVGGMGDKMTPLKLFSLVVKASTYQMKKMIAGW
jgi:hypothetical protein